MSPSKNSSNKSVAKRNASIKRVPSGGAPSSATQKPISSNPSKESEIGKPQDPAQNIKVCVRVRPITIGVEDACIWDTNSFHSSIQLSAEFSAKTKKKMDPLYYDSVFYGSDNKVLYDAIVKDSVQSCMSGINTVVFAYGQSGSGKTYSMMGYDEMPGIIPQAVDHVFDYIKKQTFECEYLLRVSYIEIYNERIRDLLDPSQEELKLLEGKNKDVVVSPLKEEIVFSPSQVMEIIQKGEQNRSWGETENNVESSRSHTIFQMVIECITKDGKITTSQLNLIDLAGSEKSTEDLERRKEGAYINRSLLTLGTVISKLTEKEEEHIPFRDSKLTRLLQKSLSGNSKICVVATISPAYKGYEESVNTLKFAARVKKIIARPQEVSNLDDKSLLEKYKSEVEHLRTKLSESHALSHKSGGIHLKSPLGESDQQTYDDELLEARMESNTLKARIAFLNKIILKASNLSAKPLLDWSAANEKNGSSVMLAQGLLPSRNGFKGKGKTQSTPALALEGHMNMTDREKINQLQDFIQALKGVNEIEKVHELINEIQSGKFEDTSDVKTALSLQKLSKIENEKKRLKMQVAALEKKLHEMTETTQFAEKNNGQLEKVVDEQHKTIVNLTRRITGIQMEFKEYREVLGRRRPPKLGEETLLAIRNSVVSEGSSKEIKGFLAYLSSIEDSERRYQLKQQDSATEQLDLDKQDNNILAKHMTPAVQAIKDNVKRHAKFESGDDFVVVDGSTIFKTIPKPELQQPQPDPLKEEVKLTIGRKDDTSATLLALSSGCEILGISVVAGNTSLLHGVENIKTVLALAKRTSIPIYKGCEAPIISGLFNEENQRWPGHDKDGFGGFTSTEEYLQFEEKYLAARSSVVVQSQHAALFLIDAVRKYPGEIEILALGPMTNLALAIKLDPEFLGLVKRVVVMGGTLYTRGNTSNTSEFNWHYDPESVHIVLESSGIFTKLRKEPVIHVVTWETTLQYGFEWDLYQKHSSSHPLGYFLNQTIVKYKSMKSSKSPFVTVIKEESDMNEFEKHYKQLQLLVLPDVVAMIACLFPEIVLEFKDTSAVIELQGLTTRGTNHFSWMALPGTDLNCRFCLKFDRDRIKNIMENFLSSSF